MKKKIKKFDEFIEDKVNERINSNINFVSNEEIEFIAEMANVVKNKSGLPMNIWISQSFPKHTPRIKAQKNYAEKVEKFNFFNLTIDNNPEVIGDIGIIKIKDVYSIK